MILSENHACRESTAYHEGGRRWVQVLLQLVQGRVVLRPGVVPAGREGQASRAGR